MEREMGSETKETIMDRLFEIRSLLNPESGDLERAIEMLEKEQEVARLNEGASWDPYSDSDVCALLNQVEQEVKSAKEKSMGGGPEQATA